MILNCPTCSTQFNVPDSALQPSGRTVRCSRCTHVWFSTADGKPGAPPVPAVVARVAAPEPEPPAPEPPVPVAAVAPPESTEQALTIPDRLPSVAMAEVFKPAMVADTAAETPALAQARAAARAGLDAHKGRSLLVALEWSAFATVIALLAGGIYFHEVLAAEYPATRPIYRLTKLMPQMSHDGLRLQGLRPEPDITQVDVRDLPAMVTISGEIINESWIPRSIRTLRGSLLDAQRKEFRRWDVVTPRAWLWPGEGAAFRSEVELEGVRPAEIVIKLQPLE